MMRIRSIIIALLLLGIAALSFAQIDTNGEKAVGVATGENIGKDSSQQKLVDITVDQFEDPGLWQGSIMNEYGLITLRQKQGFPARREILDKSRLDAERAMNNPIGTMVLGVKVVFFKRAVVSFSINPVRPLPIPGLAKTVSVWVVGRSFNHSLKLVLEDYFGQRYVIGFDKKLTFQGWDKLTAVIPPQILQTEKHYTGLAGIKIVGLTVDCDLTETYGTFYIYLDDLSSVTDLFTEESRDVDDVVDDW
jgi:hypothetical protein